MFPLAGAAGSEPAKTFEAPVIEGAVAGQAGFVSRSASDSAIAGRGRADQTKETVAKAMLREAMGQLDKETRGGRKPSLGAYERAILALAANDRHTKAVLLLGDAEAAGFALREEMYGEIIRACGKSGRVEEATRTLDKMIAKGYSPSQELLNIVLHTCMAGRATSKVTSVLLTMRARGLHLDDSTYREAMKRCAIANDPTQVVSVWNLFVGKGRKVEEIAAGDVSQVAKALGALGDWKGIVGLLQSMSTEGGGLLPPLNRLSYNWLVSAHAQLGDAEAVMSTIEDMARNGHPADADTYSLAFKAFTKSRGRHWGAALDVFRAMQSSSATVLPKGSSVGVVEAGGGGHEGGRVVEKKAGSEFLTADIWCKTITTLAQASQSRKAFSVALSLLEDAERTGVEVDAPTVDAVLAALGKGKGKDEQLLSLFQRAERRGLSLKRQSYTWAVVAYKRCGRTKEAVDAAVSFSERGIVMTIVGWNAAMHAASIIGQPDKALEFLEEAKAKGIKPTEVTYATAIGACAKDTTDKKANGLKAVSLLQEMQDAGLKPYPPAHQAALSAVASSEGHEAAIELLDKMRGEGTLLTAASYHPALKSAAAVGAWQVAIFAIDVMAKAALTSREAGPDVVCFNYAMAACAKAGECELAHRILRRMQACGLTPNLVSYGICMDACAKAGLWEKSLELLVAARTAGLSPNVVTFTTAIEACATAGKFDSVLSLLEQMSAEGVSPSVVTFSSALKACNDWDKAEQILSMMKSRGVQPNEVTYTELISICGRSGDVHQALAQLENARREGVSPNLINYNACVDVCAKTGEVDRALALLEQMQTSGDPKLTPDLVTYNSVINACAKAGDWALTLWLFSEIKAAGLKADIQSFNAALDACTKGSNPEAALALLKRMRSQGLAPDAISYQSALSACRAGGDGASAVMLLKDMEKQGLEPRDSDYNLVIETVGKEGDWGGALNLIKRMKGEGLTPDAYTYGAAVGACAKGRNPAMAKILLEEMQGLGLTPTRFCWNSVISVHARTGNTTVALALMDEMKQSMPCDETTFSNVVHGCAQTRDWKAAARLLKDMRAAGLKPNDSCYYALLAAASKAGELRLAEGLFKGMRADGLTADLYSYTTLFAGCGRFHDWRLALRLLESMKAEGLLATKKNYVAALRACSRGEAEIAGILLEMMRKQEVELDAAGRTAALVAFGRGGRADKALALMDYLRENGPPPSLQCFNAAIEACALADDVDGAMSLMAEMGRAGITPDDYSFRSLLTACERNSKPTLKKDLMEAMPSDAVVMAAEKKAVFGGGCFWCTEAVFKTLDGVSRVVSGYAGGTLENPTYRDVCSGRSGHAEVVLVEYDPAVVKFEELLEVFWKSHDPTQGNRQGLDMGTEYRSIILCEDKEQLDIAVASKEAKQAKINAEAVLGRVVGAVTGKKEGENIVDITTTIDLLQVFWEAEKVHQDYYARNPLSPYCIMNVGTKLVKLRPDISRINRLTREREQAA
eukprot:g5598.t1